MPAPDRDLDKNPYSPDERRVATFLADLTGIGGGDDPIGFIMASHAELARQRNLMRAALEQAGIPDPSYLDLDDLNPTAPAP